MKKYKFALMGCGRVSYRHIQRHLLNRKYQANCCLWFQRRASKKSK